MRSLEHKIREIMDRQKVPGVGIVVVKDDKVVYLKGLGYRNLEKKLPFTPDTICHIASTSKTFCGVTLCMAAEDGLLSLDESPKRLLPEFKMVDPEADKGMTIADLMSHSSGLPRTDAGWGPGKIDAHQAMLLLGKGEPTYPFRYIGQYSNMMVETAGLAVGAAYKKPWTQVLQEKVAGPLGMTSTRRWSLPEAEPDRTSVGYYVGPDGEPIPETIVEFPAIAAAGGLQSTPKDMATWIRFHLNGGEVDGKRLISEKMLNEAHRPRFSFVGPLTYGLGWFQSEDRGEMVVSHGGDLPGFQTDLVLCPSRHLGFAILSNNDSTNSRGPIESLLLDRLVGKSDTREFKKTAKANGLYLSPQGDHLLRIGSSGNEMQATPENSRTIRLHKDGEATWKTYDKHDHPMTIVVSDDPKNKGHKMLDVTREGGTTHYAISAPLYKPDTTVAEIYRRSAIATGGDAAPAGKTLECHYTADYASDAVQGIGLWYRTARSRSGQLESEYIGAARQNYTHGANRDGRTAFADSNWRIDQGFDPSSAEYAGYCSELGGPPKDAKVEIIGEINWKGEAAYVVRMTPIAGPYRLDYYSKTTFLPLRREVPRAHIETYSDYKVIDGIAVPMKVIVQDGNLSESRITITSARAIDGQPHWAFYPAAWKKK